jgi:penicillin G amidase
LSDTHAEENTEGRTGRSQANSPFQAKFAELDLSNLESLRAEARRVLATTSGSFKLKGLSDTVEVIRDRWGVPHIFARNEEDLFFAQGFVTAQDRLWQMELRRRLEGGRLAEAFGPAALGIDRFTRTIGLKRFSAEAFRRFDSETRQAFESYTAGVNAFIERHLDRLPIEYSIVRLDPEPFEPLDFVGFGMAYTQAGFWPGIVIRARLLNHFGQERLSEIDPKDPNGPVHIPDGLDYSWIGHEAIFPHYRFLGFPEHIIREAYIGSNSWVVDSYVSKTGAPIHCTDPHLAVAHPSTWYEIHLCGGGYDVIGCSTPGTPGIVMGHNRSLAWGMTNANAHVQDVYVERLDPSDSSKYLRGDRWENLEIESHSISVRGSSQPDKLEVKLTCHGPIIYENERGDLGLAVAWNAYFAPPEESTFSAVLKLAKCQTVEEFQEVLEESWCAPALNFVFCDRQGRIRRVTASRLPKRRIGDGLLPAPGWDLRYDWEGLTTPEEMPKELGKRNHVILSANERTTTDTSPHLVSRDWDPGFRANRIRAYLAERRKVGVEDMVELQNDVKSIPASEFVQHVLALRSDSEAVKKAQRLFSEWDFRLSRDSAAAALYEVALRRAVLSIFGPKFVRVDFASWLDGARGPWIALLDRLSAPDEYWFGDFHSGDPQLGRDAALTAAIEEAVEELSDKFGPDPSGWRWGALHTLYYDHSAARIPILRELFNRGPFEMPGDIHTVNNTGALLRFGYRQLACSSYKHVVDMADFDRSLSVHHPGQSGQPESPHFDDFIELYVDGRYHPQLYSREAIEEHEEATLLLEPD